MPIHSPHCPCHHSVPSMLQTPVNSIPGAEISQARLLWCSPASALEQPGTAQQLQGSIHLLTTKKCKAAEIMLYPGFWGLSCGDYGFSCPLGNLYTFSIGPGCLLFSVPPLQALLSWGSQPWLLPPSEWKSFPYQLRETHSSPCSYSNQIKSWPDYKFLFFFLYSRAFNSVSLMKLNF